ncbi:hypothetical protein K501DRAFT_335827 [Backusella circina FSU 941]|nr:hypothetical protein K501DRAFT_335827 [Backusella circina FSU 941]
MQIVYSHPSFKVEPHNNNTNKQRFTKSKMRPKKRADTPPLSEKSTTTPNHSSDEEEEDVCQQQPPSDMITPPPSPKSIPILVSASFEANERLLTAKRHGQLKFLMSEYASLRRGGHLFTDHTFNLFFDSYINLRRDGTPLTPMMKVYDDMIQSGIQPSSSTYSLVIRILCKRDVEGQLEIALAMYTACIDSYKSSSWETARMERAIYMVSNSILIGYAQQGDMVNAKKYYQQIKSLNRYPDGNGYASLLLGSAKCATDEATDALIIYDEAKRHDVKPTTFFYNVVISKLAKARKLESAMRLFEEMQSFDIMPNSITYGAIISASVRAGSETLARKLFSDMIASTQPPRVGPFNNMIQFYVRQQPDREKALSYFAELRRCRIKPSAHTYKLLMEAYCSIAPYDMPTAYRMLSEMELRDRIRPSATHYATLIYSYGILQRDVRSADRVFEEMSKKHVLKDEVVYQAILDTLISNDQLTRAEELYATMRTEITRSSCPYIENVFIRGYGQHGLVQKARVMFDAMTDDKINHGNEVIREPSTFEAMVRAYADNDQLAEAKEVFELMVQREFPEKVTAVVAELVSNA